MSDYINPSESDVKALVATVDSAAQTLAQVTAQTSAALKTATVPSDDPNQEDAGQHEVRSQIKFLLTMLILGAFSFVIAVANLAGCFVHAVPGATE